MQMRNEIQMLTQAHALATSDKDDALLVLIDRWRTASRAAAEELFASTRDRVNRMGGVAAWKEREKEQSDWRRKADMEEMQAERERLEAQQEESGGERTYEEYGDVGEGLDKGEEVETFKCADDDVSSAVSGIIGSIELTRVVVHDGYDAQDAQHRPAAHRLQRRGTAVGRLRAEETTGKTTRDTNEISHD
jgi:hypothetical protein